MEKRYQVFLSSTYLDLKKERSAVINAILDLNHFPAGMELFPAAPETPWETIQGVIDSSDYYIVVVGGKYGSTAEDGTSYTEKEYDYARAQDKYIIPLIHADLGKLIGDLLELEKDRRDKLQAFIEKLKRNHTVKSWNTADNLASTAITSLIHAIKIRPAVGWVRADGIDSVGLLTRVTELQDENAELREQVRIRQSERNPEAAEIADNLDDKDVRWFLEQSARRQPSLDQSTEPTIYHFLTRQRMVFQSRVTQLGWAVRDELLRRAMLFALLDTGSAKRGDLHACAATVQEAEKTIEELLADDLIERIIIGESTSYKLSANGSVAVTRLRRHV